MRDRGDRSASTRPDAPWVRPLAWFAAGGVASYVVSWVVAGWWREGYDPTQQAISELFELGAPIGPRILVTAGLVVSAVALVALGPVLDRGLPGSGRLGPVLASLSGVLTLGAVAFPCSSGCPGFGASTTDTWHAITAGGGYVTLIVAPLVVGWRLRGHHDALARWSLLLGLLALAGFVLRNGVIDAYGGLQQRMFNTVADGWYLVVAVAIARRPGPARGEAQLVAGDP